MIYVTKYELCGMDSEFVGQTEKDSDGNYVSVWEVVSKEYEFKILVLLREHFYDSFSAGPNYKE